MVRIDHLGATDSGSGHIIYQICKPLIEIQLQQNKRNRNHRGNCNGPRSAYQSRNEPSRQSQYPQNCNHHCRIPDLSSIHPVLLSLHPSANTHISLRKIPAYSVALRENAPIPVAPLLPASADFLRSVCYSIFRILKFWHIFQITQVRIRVCEKFSILSLEVEEK